MTKRKASTSVPRPCPIDIAMSPPHASHTSFPESSLRSTLNSNDFRTRDARPSTYLDPTAPPFAPQSRKGTKARPIPQTQRQRPAPSRDRADSVYMMNAAAGSYSKTLDQDDSDNLPDHAEITVRQILRVRQLADINRRLAVSPLKDDDDVSAWSPAEKVKWHEDLLQRNMVARIKQRLQGGALLTLERSSWTAPPTICDHPLCTQPKTHNPCFYFVLSLPNSHQNQQLYCLSCLEALWNGFKMQGSLPNPDIFNFSIPSPPCKASTGLALDGVRESLGSASDLTCPSLLSACSTPDTPRTNLSLAQSPRSPSSPKTTHPFIDHHHLGPKIPAEVEELEESAKPQTRRTTRHSFRTPTAQEAAREHAMALLSRLGSKKRPSTRELGGCIKTVVDAEAKLAKLYEVRDELAETVQPGESINVQLRKTSRTDTPQIHADAFGIVYTDLLSQPLDRPKPSQSSSLVVPKSCNKHNVKKLHGCVCHGLFEPGAVLWCMSESCLIGWYHLDCVENWAETDDDWLCPLCSEHMQPSTPSSPFTPSDVENWFAPPYSSSPSPVFDYKFSPFDGPNEYDAIFESIMQSKHSPPPDDMKALLSSSAIERESSSPMSWSDEKVSTPSLIRFQHLARFIRPGASLSDIIKATVNLWRLASQQQLAWEAHAQRTIYNRSFDSRDPAAYTPPSQARSVPADSELVDVDDEQILAAKSFVSVEECESTALSTPLGLMHERYKRRFHERSRSASRGESVDSGLALKH